MVRPGAVVEEDGCLAQPVEVALLFPPLVYSNFGSYYPSTAVLAGYLSQSDIRSCQIDLNEIFALFLLRPHALEEMAVGNFGLEIPRTLEAMECVAARLLARNRHLLFDDMDRHDFQNTGNGLARLIRYIVEPYTVDLPLTQIVETGLDKLPVTPVYLEFFQWGGITSKIPNSVNTIGISVPMGPQLLPSLLLARYIRLNRPDISIVLGGPTLSLMAEANIEFLLSSFPDVDAIVQYDGELPLRKLLEQKREGFWRPDLIPGVSCSRNGEIIHNAPERGLSLNALPFAEYSPELLRVLADPQIGIVQARGCYWGKCAYCDYVELYEGSSSFRSRAIPNFVEEIKHQVALLGITRFSFITEALPPRFASRLSDALMQQNINIKWHSFAMVDERFSAEILERMALAGCQYLVIGVETMNSRVLRHVRKAATEDGNVSFFRRASNCNIELVINLIPNLPTTTYAEAMEALEVVRTHSNCFNQVSIFPFEATMSSAIGRDPESFGLVVVSQGEGTGQAQYSSNHLGISDPAMSSPELAEVIAAYRSFADKVNGRNPAPKQVRFVEESCVDDCELRFADEYVDVVRTDGSKVRCYNWATREFVSFSHEGFYALLIMVRNMKWFRKQDFVDIFPNPDLGNGLFSELIHNHLLVTRIEV